MRLLSPPRAVARAVPRVLVPFLVLVTALLLGPAAQARAATDVATNLTLTAPVSVGAGVPATVAGSLLDATGKPVGKATVSVAVRTLGTTKWVRTATATTNGKGAWSARVTVQLNSEVRAMFAGQPGFAAATSLTRGVTAGQSLRITLVNPARPLIGDKVTISGTTSQALRGTTVGLQRLTAGAWSTVARAKVSATGTWSASLRVADARTLTLRVASTSSTAITQTISAIRYVYPRLTATLYAGQRLDPRHVLTAPNGLYTATMGTDGALALRSSTGTLLWSSRTSGAGAALRLSPTGNLTLGTASKTQWSTKTSGKVPRLVLQNNGSLVLFDRGKSLWSAAGGKGAAASPAACKSVTFDCISYSGYVPTTSYWAMYPGHNCTNYVAYRMGLKGLRTPPWGLPGGSAWQWSGNARKAGVKVDTTPVVGAVMQWDRNTNGGGRSGHVVYVEQVSATSVTISEDSWSGYSAVRTIPRTSSSYKAAHFIHIADELS